VADRRSVALRCVAFTKWLVVVVNNNHSPVSEGCCACYPCCMQKTVLARCCGPPEFKDVLKQLRDLFFDAGKYNTGVTAGQFLDVLHAAGLP
jgi:hypothetical protein